MDTFLEDHIFKKLNEEAENLNILITACEIEAVVKKTPGTQKPWMRCFHRRFLQNL